MDHNLLPPFVLRESGIRVNDTPKIHKVNPTVDDHAIIFSGEGLRIPSDLWGNLLDWEGNVLGKTDEVNIILADIQDDEDMASSMMIGSAEV
eukprot:5511789-Ditylum_brightwellii.AAC.1